MADELTFDALRDNIARLNLELLAEEAAENTVADFVELNKDQLMHGFRSDGNTLQPYRSKEYADRKHAMNALPGYGIPDYKLTGAYQAAFVGEVINGGLQVISMDNKENKLAKREGSVDQNAVVNVQEGRDAIFGLNDKSTEVYIGEKFQPEYYEIIHRALNLL